ncbi:MAG: NAD-dependent epimerase/dehydratase family protein [Cytophagaceae bacterium]|nr:NAD-dependent epimerase/dehydratase family protein [Gemmatimonadaceae bacterium]
MDGPRTIDELEERLSRPSDAAIATLRELPGDIVILGAGGKMGPSLASMARRAADAAGTPRRVVAVSRFSSEAASRSLTERGVDVSRADLADPAAWRTLPDAALVVYMVGQKFGTQGAPGRTWHTNTVIPAFATDRYRDARFVAFSTGNVYPLTPVARGGSLEGDAPAPVGEYAMSCLGRERVFEYAAATWGTRSTILRLNYAVDLRYGVLVDIARQILVGTPVDVTMGWVNCIWQGDANALALASLRAAAAPPTVLNLSGPETLRVRDVAVTLAGRLGANATIHGQEAPDALLSNTQALQARWGAPSVSADALISWVAAWLAAGGETSGKPTRFEQREGAF